MLSFVIQLRNYLPRPPAPPRPYPLRLPLPRGPGFPREAGDVVGGGAGAAVGEDPACAGLDPCGDCCCWAFA